MEKVDECARPDVDGMEVGSAGWLSPHPTTPVARRVPVVVFHGLCDGTCPASQVYSIPISRFDEMMAGLVERGYDALTAEDYALYLQGRLRGSTRKPILITFDDGRADGYLGADPVLQKHHLHATSFLITAEIKDTRGFFVSWADVLAANASGRWDMQLHAHHGHTTIPTGPADETGLSPMGDAYASREWRLTPGTETWALESHDEWRARVRGDLDTGVALLREKVPGFVPLIFAVPFGDYGEFQTNDRRISEDLRWEFDHRFFAWFTQESSNPAFTPPVQHAEHHRFRVDATVTTAMFFAWLARHGG